jgi:hypothetical protein
MGSLPTMNTLPERSSWAVFIGSPVAIGENGNPAL